MTTVPRVGEGGVFGWFETMARAHGDHPRMLLRCGKVLAAAGIRACDLTDDVLREATKRCYVAAKEWETASNRGGAYVVVEEAKWFAYGATFYNGNGHTKQSPDTGDTDMATATKEKAAKKTIKVSREDAVALLREMGAAPEVVTDDTKAKPLERMLQANLVNARETEIASVSTAKLRDMFDAICDTVRGGGRVEVSGGKPAPKAEAAPSVASKTTAGKNGSAKHAGKKGGGKQTAKEGVGRDKFGARVGSKVAAVNAALSKKPRTMAEIMEAAGVKDTFYGHLKRMAEAGHVVKSDKGYALK